MPTMLTLLSKLPTAVSGWDGNAEDRKAEAAMFPNAVAEYAKLDRSLIHSGVAVNSKEGIALLKDMQPDVVVCFGGPVYRQAFIEACPMVLNYHSGVSPLYNGTASARFAFANGHPHLCGGTLMKMSAVVDGGDLLGHFLPAIDERDTPATLFMKTAHGAATMYHGCLAHLEREGSNWAGLPQGRPLFYFRSADWTVHHGQRVRAHLRAGRAGKFQRPERVLEYWRGRDKDSAQQVFEAALTGLLLSKS